mmetsp:Transcript_26466/g.80285  ORF Transcript_26466/g.80285 Transcript_26466/m.80285 type:complete len:227 (+) Transcript_26466:1274-1954(+)
MSRFTILSRRRRTKSTRSRATFCRPRRQCSSSAAYRTSTLTAAGSPTRRTPTFTSPPPNSRRSTRASSCALSTRARPPSSAMRQSRICARYARLRWLSRWRRSSRLLATRATRSPSRTTFSSAPLRRSAWRWTRRSRLFVGCCPPIRPSLPRSRRQSLSWCYRCGTRRHPRSTFPRLRRRLRASSVGSAHRSGSIPLRRSASTTARSGCARYALRRAHAAHPPSLR